MSSRVDASGAPAFAPGSCAPEGKPARALLSQGSPAERSPSEGLRLEGRYVLVVILPTRTAKTVRNLYGFRPSPTVQLRRDLPEMYLKFWIGLIAKRSLRQWWMLTSCLRVY